MTIELENDGREADTGPPEQVLASRPAWERWCVAAILLYFLARLLYLALNIAPGIPPDEPTHVGIVKLYAETPFLIEDSPESYHFGLVTRTPFLYYWLMGKFALLDLFGMDDTIYLRILNVILSMLTALVGYRLAARLCLDPLVRVLFLVMVTNTLMFTFIGAAVSYDNLVNLLATLALYALVSFAKNDEPRQLLLLALWIALGALTKITFLPLALLLVLALLVERRKKIAGDVIRVLGPDTWRDRGRTVLAVLVLISAATGALLYGGNLLRYGRLSPACGQVLEHEQCMENRIYARNWVVNQYRNGAMSFEQALRETARIGHPGDRDHASRLLQHERSYRQSQPKLLPLWDYMLIVWHQVMKPTIFGIQAHASMSRDAAGIVPYSIVLFAGLLLAARGLSWRGDERLWVYLAGLSVGYYAILVGWFNYTHYLRSHAPFLGVQGRYIFPVMIPACLVIARFMLIPWRSWFKTVLAVAVAAIFVLGDVPYFRRHATDNWFRSKAINQLAPEPANHTDSAASH
jgi:hypothetical protein